VSDRKGTIGYGPDWFDSGVGHQAIGVDELVSRGWARLEGYLGPASVASLAKPAGLAWRPLAPRVGAITQSGWFAQVPIEEVPGQVRALGSVIHGLVEQSVGAHVPAFNEATWQRYLPGSGHIDPHRDQAFYKGPIVIVTLAGRARFVILASRNPPVVSASWATGDGDVVILRGAGLGGPESRCPLHSVGPPATERLTVSFRHNETGPGGWAER
jgi:hypothetical protein